MKKNTRKALRDRADSVAAQGPKLAWWLPIVLVVVIAVVVILLARAIGLATSGNGEGLSARLTWGVAAMLFTVMFVFSVIMCIVIMFGAGDHSDAILAAVVTTLLGAIATITCVSYADGYMGPSDMRDLLGATALCLGGVRTLTGYFDGFAVWASLLVLATSCVIVRNEVKTEEELSSQLRYAGILMFTAAALLIAGVSETSALHKWPGHEPQVGAGCPRELPPNWRLTYVKSRDDYQKRVDTSATAISSSIGTIFSLVLAAAYLPLALVLRQRAYAVIKPPSRTEAWLAVHGFSLQPTQQLAKVLLILSPLLAGGPVSYLITLLSK